MLSAQRRPTPPLLLLALGLGGSGLASCATFPAKIPPASKAEIHVFSEGYLSGGTGVDTTAVRETFGRWKVTIKKGAPGHWSPLKSHFLRPAQAAALDGVLEQPSSYEDEPAPGETGNCLDPWSMRIDWSWRSRTGALYQQCGPWGAGERISALLEEPTR
jgi:hypothetical protein